jgi:hypothetical protein
MADVDDDAVREAIRSLARSAAGGNARRQLPWVETEYDAVAAAVIELGVAEDEVGAAVERGVKALGGAIRTDSRPQRGGRASGGAQQFSVRTVVRLPRRALAG